MSEHLKAMARGSWEFHGHSEGMWDELGPQGQAIVIAQNRAALRALAAKVRKDGLPKGYGQISVVTVSDALDAIADDFPAHDRIISGARDYEDEREKIEATAKEGLDDE